MTYREDKVTDLDLLTAWNHQLIADEGADNPMAFTELRERISDWLNSAVLQAIVFSIDDEDIAYALFQETDDAIHLRQFFVARDHRRKGHGRAAMQILKTEVWPANKPLTVGVLTQNTDAYTFWREMGYEATIIKMEIPRS